MTSLTNGNTYSYDANGNMTGRTVGGQNYTLGYDAENHLTSVSGVATASYVYNGDGQRVKAVVNGVTTVYIGSHYEYTLSSSTAKKYYYAGSTRVAMRDDASSLYWLLSDHLGSTMKSVKASDGATSERRYRAWGETRFTNGTTPTNYRYTGQYEQPEIGLYYYGARWYDTALGRFTSPDTIIPEASQGVQAWDRYAGMANNPVRYSDPTGHAIACGDGQDTGACGGETAETIYKQARQYHLACQQSSDEYCIGWYQIENDIIILYGYNFSASTTPGKYWTGGQEGTFFIDDFNRATYSYVGDGGAVGLGGNTAAYVGIAWNVETPDDYKGNVASVGVTVSAKGKGVTIGYFWPAGEDPVFALGPKGFIIGYAPGVHFSLWYSVTNYILDWAKK